MKIKTQNSRFDTSRRRPAARGRHSFTLVELMLVITIVAIIVGIGIPAFVGITRGAAAKQAKLVIEATLKQAQQTAIINRQRIGFYVVTQVLDTNNIWVTANMTNRSYFLYAVDTPSVAKHENFITSVQTLPPPMMFDFTGSSLPTIDVNDSVTGSTIFRIRGFRFAPSGIVYYDDADATPNHRIDIVLVEGLAGAGGTYTMKTTGNIIRYTNSVSTFTGKVYSQ